MGVGAGLPVSDRGHCKDANTVHISVQSILLEISGKGGRQKKKGMETGRIRI
jgi:hypothetical protein